MWKEFKDFLMRGNVVDLAVAVVLGVAFGAIVNSLVNDIIMPLVGIALGGVDLTSLVVQVGSAQVRYGNFIQAAVNFLIIAFVIFLVVRAYNRFKAKPEEKAPTPEAPPAEVVLLIEIRDLLRERTRSV